MTDSKNSLHAFSSGNRALNWSISIISPPSYFGEDIIIADCQIRTHISLFFDHKTEKILVEKDHVEGVRLSNGEVYRADHIVSAADGYSTLYDLLEGKYITAELKKLHEEWPLWKPVVLI